MNEQRQTREQLLEELADLRRQIARLETRVEWADQLLKAAPLGIHDCDTEGRITFVNPSQEAVTGYTAEELLGTRIWDRMPPGPEKDSLPAYLQRLVAEQPPPTPYLGQNIRKNGEVFDVRVDWNYQRDGRGQVIGFVCIVSDITEQNKAQAARQQTEERYRTLAESTIDIVYIVDRDGTLLYANRSAVACIGIDASALVGKRQQDLFPPEAARLHMERIERVFETGEVGENDELFHFGPQEIWLNIRSIPLRDEQGRITAVMGVCRDITERKRTEEALRAERNRAQQYLDIAAILMVVLDKDGNIVLLNRKGHEILGHPEGTLLGQNWFRTCVPERVRKDVLSAFQMLMAGKIQPAEYYENPVVTRTGEERILAWHNALLTDANGQMTGTLSSGTDVTEQIQAEQRLRESEERFREAMEATSDGLWDWNVETGEVYYSPAYFRMLGYEDSEHVNHVQSWTDLLHPDDRAEAVRVNQDCIAGRIPHFQVEFRVRAKDGQWKTILGRGKAMRRDASGRATRMIGTHVDITARKRAEEALQEAHDELEQRVRDRTAELSRANEALAQSEAKYRHLVEATDTGYLILDEEGRVVDANGEYVRLTGRKSLDDIRGRKVLEWTAPHDIERNAREVAQCLQTGAVRQLEVDYIGPEGKLIPVEINACVIDTERGRRILSLCRDITERKRAEQELQQSRDEFQVIYDGMVDGLLIADCVTGGLLRTNPAMCRMLGYPPEQLLSMSVRDIHPPEVVPDVLEKFRTQQEGVRLITENRPVRKEDGTVFYADISNTRISYHGQPCILGLFRDITERKRAEQELQQNRDELQAIYDQMMDGIIIVDAEKVRAVHINPAYCRMIGYTVEEVRTVSPETLHPPEVFPVILAHFEEVKRAGIAHLEGLPFIRKDGIVVYADVVSTGIHYNNRPSWFSFFHDVTDRRRALVALERERRTLELMLRASDHERQTIAYDIHDGLAQQLAGAIMQFQVFEYAKDTNPDQALKAYRGGVALLQQGHAEARRIISGVRPPILDESGVVAAIAHLVHDPSVAHGPQVSFYSKADFQRLPSIMENAIYRIVQEGLTNARKHSTSPKIRISLLQRGDRVRIEIRDWGIGFNPRKVKKNRFGLAGIRERTRLLGGKCAIRSALGEGTSIVVMLPLLLKEPEE